mmetsp:Transcript_7036/g.30920  ORF Transcript_7036/g.30920 Transcript_7036/m.30920 type:complete len:293 (-) Transcript_7036:99-977(-)
MRLNPRPQNRWLSYSTKCRIFHPRFVIPNIREMEPKYPSLFCFSSVPSSVGSRGSHDRNRPGAPGRLVSAGFAREPPPPALTVLANDMTEDAPDARPRLRRLAPSIPDDDAPPTLAASSPAAASTSSLVHPPLGDPPPPSAADTSPMDSRRDGGAEPYGLVPAVASPRSTSDPALPRLLSRLSVFLPTMEAIRSSVNGDFRPVGEWVMLPTGEGSFELVTPFCAVLSTLMARVDMVPEFGCVKPGSESPRAPIVPRTIPFPVPEQFLGPLTNTRSLSSVGPVPPRRRSRAPR